jgi:glycine/D-amino acid oxidase-like deaminating enzyme
VRVVVLGAGVIGVTSAWYLAKAGLEVELVDRQALPGLETSFANGGQLTAGSSQAWASPAPACRPVWCWIASSGTQRCGCGWPAFC